MQFDAFSIVKSVFVFMFHKPSRQRLLGYRIQVIVALVSKKEKTILLGKTGNGKNWLLPQEGVKIGQTHKEALYSCLKVECGIPLPKNEDKLARMLYCRGFHFLGKTKLPKERHGSRPVAGNSVGTIFENRKLIGKSFWISTCITKSETSLKYKADGVELTSLKWFSKDEAREIIHQTCRPEKAKLLDKALDYAFSQLGEN